MHEPSPPPSVFGLLGASRLQLLTEFVGDTPTPQVQRRVRRPAPDTAARSATVEPDFTDDTLDFGAVRPGTGRAFLSGRPWSRTATGLPLAVGKRFERIDSRRIRIKAVEWRGRQWLLTTLPASSLHGIFTNAASSPAPSATAPLAGTAEDISRKDEFRFIREVCG